MKPHEFALKNPWAVLVVSLIVVVVGLRAFFMMPKEYFPDTHRPQVAVVTVEPGAAATDVSRRITEVIEKELASISGLRKITSSSRDEVSSVSAEFEYGKPMGQAVVDVQNGISRIRADLPADIMEPRIYRITDATRPLVTLALSPKLGSGITMGEIRLLADNDIKDFLLNIKGVADVDTFGANELQINIWLNQDRLEALGITPMQVMKAVKDQNITTPSGLMHGPHGETLIKTVGEFKDLHDIDSLIIKQDQNGYIRLKDVARTELGIKDVRSIYHGNGKPAIAINILRAEKGNVTNAIKNIKKNLPEMRNRWSDINFQITDDQEPLIDRNTSGMRVSLYMSIILTVIIIFLFLADIKVSSIALISIPLSFLFGIAALSFTGYTINIVTLSGLIIATGMVVDATVVTVENISRYKKEKGKLTSEVVKDAVSEILISITAGLLTTVTMLIPIMFAGGYVEKVLRQFTLTLALALVGSLLAAIFVVPPLALKLVKEDSAHKNFIEKNVMWFGRLVDMVADGYVYFLRFGMRHRIPVMIVSVMCLVLTVKTVMPLIGREMMPKMDTGIVKVFFETPPQTKPEDMEKILSKIEAVINTEPSVKMISSTAGSEPGQISFGAGGQTAQQAMITVNLLTRDQRKNNIWQIEDQWRSKMSKIKGLRSLQVYEFGATPMSSSRAPVDILISGRDPKVLKKIARDIMGRIKGITGAVDPNEGWWLDKKEMHVRVDRKMAGLYRVTPEDIADQLRVGVDGVKVSGMRVKGFLDIPVRVSFDEKWVKTKKRLENFDIFTPRGIVPLRALASVTKSDTQTVITRENLENTLDITMYNSVKRLSQVAEELGKRIKGYQLPKGYSIKMSGTIADMKDSMPRVFKAVLLGFVLLIVLLIGVFESFSLPLPILIAIPLSVIGSLWGLLLYSKPMCMPAMMGMLLLAGIVINNSIFLIDFIKQARKTGMDRSQALEQSVRLRLRPVLMTTISTFVGMLPIIYETAVGLERMSPLGTAAGFGLLVGTVMTMIVTPVFYSLLDDAGIAIKRVFGSDS